MCDFINFKDCYICYDEYNTRLMNIIDNKFRDEAKIIGASEYHIPALINHEVLKRCGYFSSFPQHLTIASYINPKNYWKVAEGNIITNEIAILSDQYFTPAACLHIYPMLENEEIDKKIITTKARVYRYENSNFNGNTRLWDFTVREIVFIGNKDFVTEKLQYMKERAQEYATDIGLPAKIISATDNFYPAKKNTIKQKLQISNSLKYELVVSIDDNEVAIASFNYHDLHFSKPFNFDNCGKIVTGCVGYGLERWVATLNSYNIIL